MCGDFTGKYTVSVSHNKVDDKCYPFTLQKAFAALCHSTHLYGRRLVLEWADAEETVETLRRKTAEHFHGKSETLFLYKSAEVMKLFIYFFLTCDLFSMSVATKKQRKAEVLEGILETMEMGGVVED